MKKKLNISFSGGRTSAYMTKMLIDNYSDKYEFLVTFANTGQEHPATLDFVHRCDVEWGFNTVWVEAVVNPEKGNGIRHKVVTYETACRNGEPFEAVIAKEGIANSTHPICSDRLKLLPMKDYIKQTDFNDAPSAIGIRIDENRRAKDNAIESGVVYPLIDWFPTTKREILEWCKGQLFDLELTQERQGNCVWCWKKTMSKHIANIHENRSWYDFPAYLEERYGHIYKYHGADSVFFRGNRSTKDLLAIADLGEQMSMFPDLNTEIIVDDIENECGESCEVFPMEYKK